MLIERNEGMLERCLVSGVTGIEILFSHVITQFCVMSFQTALVLTFSFSIFDLTNHGEIFWVIMLVLETGFCGMCFGKKNIFLRVEIVGDDLKMMSLFP